MTTNEKNRRLAELLGKCSHSKIRSWITPQQMVLFECVNCGAKGPKLGLDIPNYCNSMDSIRLILGRLDQYGENVPHRFFIEITEATGTAKLQDRAACASLIMDLLTAHAETYVDALIKVLDAEVRTKEEV